MSEIGVGTLIIELGGKNNLVPATMNNNNIINTEQLKPIFKEIVSIKTIMFSGGEPMLYINKMIEILSAISDNNCSIDNFYIGTNGTIDCDNFLEYLVNFYYLYCRGNCSRNNFSLVSTVSSATRPLPIETEKFKEISFCGNSGFPEDYDVYNKTRNIKTINNKHFDVDLECKDYIFVDELFISSELLLYGLHLTSAERHLSKGIPYEKGKLFNILKSQS